MLRLQGRKGWGQGGSQSPGAESLWGDHWSLRGVPKSPNNVTSTFFKSLITAGVTNHCGGVPKCPNNVASTFLNTVYLLQKDLGFDNGDSKLASCPGRQLTSLRPCACVRVI